MQRQRGFTLVESLVVLAIVSLLVQAALPSWREFLREQAIKSASLAWIATLQRAREEALLRQRDVHLVPLDPGNWAAGWALTLDANRNQRLDAGEITLQVYRPVSARLTHTFNIAHGALVFNANGRPKQAFTLTLELEGGRRNIVVNLLGRVRSCMPDTGANSC